ncbi:MAG: sigma-70 family RNA polymerase sigma factor [Saprospiraceae bacterium]|nr:sigma-70 family RNA polymerase sigma factor [Saprospiraceae bacterium]
MDAQDYIDRVRRSLESRNEVMRELYENKQLRSNCHKYVLSNSGTKEDADTLHAESIISFIQACYRPDFNIRTTLENYLFGVTRNLWLSTLRKRKKDNPTDNLPDIEDPQNPEILLISTEKRAILYEILGKLDDKCREVLILWAQNLKMKSIATEMNYSSPEVVRKKKHFCLKRLIELIDDHPPYRAALKGDL